MGHCWRGWIYEEEGWVTKVRNGERKERRTGGRSGRWMGREEGKTNRM